MSWCASPLGIRAGAAHPLKIHECAGTFLCSEIHECDITLFVQVSADHPVSYRSVSSAAAAGCGFFLISAIMPSFMTIVVSIIFGMAVL